MNRERVVHETRGGEPKGEADELVVFLRRLLETKTTTIRTNERRDGSHAGMISTSVGMTLATTIRIPEQR